MALFDITSPYAPRGPTPREVLAQAEANAKKIDAAFRGAREATRQAYAGMLEAALKSIEDNYRDKYMAAVAAVNAARAEATKAARIAPAPLPSPPAPPPPAQPVIIPPLKLASTPQPTPSQPLKSLF
jgi:hypothetical protein